MSMSKNLKVLLAGSLLLTLASCGNNDDSSSTRSKKKEPVLSSVNWKIVLEGRSFPEKTRVDINGTTVVNECVAKQRYGIDRYTQPEMLYLDNYFVPVRGQLKIDVIDMGSDCESHSTFISNDRVDFEMTKNAGIPEVLIRL